MNPDAESIAAALDRERKERGSRGPLHGIPILIKDNIDTHDRMMTTAGSLALVGSKPARDAFIAQKLREAGAVILGKTNLSEWANFRSMKSSSGWSARGGQTKNPYSLERNPCGSSSGSGAAVAANLCAAAIGTETDGSIVCPSTANSLVGIKPTIGLVSRAGIIPIAHSQDTAGPMTRTVSDAAIVLNAITGIDPRDESTNDGRGKSADYTKFLDRDGLKGMRLGIARKHFGFNERVDKVMNDALEAMKKLGAVLVDPSDIPTTGKFDESEFEVLLYEFKADLNAYLAGTWTTGAGSFIEGRHRFQRKESRTRDALFRPGHHDQSGGERTTHQQTVPSSLAKKSFTDANPGHRFHHEEESTRCAGGSDWRTSVVNRLGQRRSLFRRLFIGIRSGGLSAHHRSRRLCLWLTGWHFLLW